MAKGIILLGLYHLLLFRHVYFLNPYVYATSEALEQAFASSILLGRCLRHPQVVHDPYYYPDYLALPFLSSYYPPHLFQAWVGSWLSLNGAWRVYVGTMVAHFLLCSWSVYILCLRSAMSPWAAMFAAVTLSSLGYAMKQNSSIIYTCAWVPILLLAAPLHSTGLFGISLGMLLLAGYWPVALYTLPLACWLWLLA